MWMISIAALSITALLCALGVFHRAYNDNVLQRVGMSWLCIAAIGRVWWIWQTQITDPSWMLVHVGMAIYAIGTAKKVLLMHARLMAWPWIVRFDSWLFAKQTDSGAFDDKPHVREHWKSP